MLVYKITNLINNKIYIGQTTLTLQKRINSHIVLAKKDFLIL
jgi:predicted GIY-YIG superfamily endonuclease